MDYFAFFRCLTNNQVFLILSLYSIIMIVYIVHSSINSAFNLQLCLLFISITFNLHVTELFEG